MTCAELIKICSSFDLLPVCGFKLSESVNTNAELECSHLPTPLPIHLMTRVFPAVTYMLTGPL